MNYKVITETLNKPFAKGKQMYLVPIDMDKSDLLGMALCKELCLSWIILEESEVALDALIQDMGLKKTIDRCISSFHQSMYGIIKRLYILGNDMQVDQMISDMDNYIEKVITDHHNSLIKN